MNNIAQKKANSYPGQQPRIMSTPRGIPSRGTVQRAQALVQTPITWFFNDIPAQVASDLKEMPDKIAAFKTLCQEVVNKVGPINVIGFEPTDNGPKGAYVLRGKVYVNKNLPHDEMVNVIVFELTNLMHEKLLKQASKLADKTESAELIEQNEYHGVLIQSGIMREAKKLAYVKKTPYADLTEKGGRWETFEKYLEEQKRTGHTGRYQ